MNKHILIILTGGTISMNKDLKSNLVDISKEYETLIDELKTNLPGVEIDHNVFSMIPSPHMTLKDMFNLAKLIESNIQSNKYHGIVVTHGTDTLEETAYMVDVMVQTKKPIVFTGSMRSYSDISYDGIRNLLSACLVALSDDSNDRETLVVLNDEINSASEVTKTHTLALDTFKSPNFGPLGIIDDQNVIFYRNKVINTKHINLQKIDKNVEIIKISADTSSLLLNFAIESKVDGIVIEALGRGNITPRLVPYIRKAIDNNIPVVLTSRVPMGRVLGTYGYDGGGGQLEKMGVIFASNINSQKARIKLILLLSSNIDKNDFMSFFA